MTEYEPVTDHDLDMVDLMMKHPDMPVEPTLLRNCLFQMAQHIRRLHANHEAAFNAGVEFQKNMEKMK